MSEEKMTEEKPLPLASVASASTEDVASITIAVEEGKHMQILRNAVDSTINKCVSATRFSMFGRMYPSVHSKAPEALKRIYKTYKDQVSTVMKGELDTLFQENDMIDLMNELDLLSSEAPKDMDKPAWRPTGDPAADLRSHLMPVKEKQKEKLQQLLSELEEENEVLGRVLMNKREALHSTISNINRKKENLQECLAHVGLQEENILAFVKDAGAINNYQ